MFHLYVNEKQEKNINEFTSRIIKNKNKKQEQT